MAEESDLRRWRDFWTALIERQRSEYSQTDRPTPSKADVARQLRRDAAELSRLIMHAQSPRNQSLVADAAKLFGASDEEIRALLVLHQIICAERHGDKELAAHYRAMFRPVYGERKFLSDINPLPNIIFQVLCETGVERTEAVRLTSAVVPSLILGKDGVLSQLARIIQHPEFKSVEPAFSGLSLAQLRGMAEKHVRILTIDLCLPWGRRAWQREQRMSAEPVARAQRPATPYRLRHISPDVGQIEHWDVIPYVGLTRANIRAGKRLSDRAHDGVEFVAILKGQGTFEMDGIGAVVLDPEKRYLIGYQPTTPHSFTASDRGATIIVIEYQGPSVQGRDPIDDLIVRAQRQAGMRPTGGTHGNQ